ncbi:MAG: hypothetical protein WBA57_08785 [Elainellaceae cyanobacterium]
MPIQILVRALKSRVVREAIVGAVGERVLQVGGEDEMYQPGEDQPSFLERIVGIGRRVVGFLINVVRTITWSFTRAFSWLLARYNELISFNFNASDAEINGLIRQNNIALASQWGSVAGSATGWISAGVLGAGIGFIMPVIGGALLSSVIAGNVSREGLEEIGANLAQAVNQSGVTLLQNSLLAQLKNTRAFLKSRPGVAEFFLGEERATRLLEYWGAPGGEAWSIAGAFEETIELIENDTARAFADAFFDEFGDSFIEGGYIIAGTLDEMWAANKRQKKENLGEFREVIVRPDREVDERIYMAGYTNTLMPAIATTLANHQMLFNRDVGEIVGQPAFDWYRANIQRRKLTVEFIDKDGPPMRHTNGDRVRRATYSIPDVRAGVDWARIKRAARTYTWGKFRAVAKLDNGRQMAVYGATPEGARDKLEDLLELSTAEVISMNISEEVERNITLRKTPTQMWPYRATLLVRRGSADRTGRTDLQGNTFDEEILKFYLWPDTEPPDMPIIPAGGD